MADQVEDGEIEDRAMEIDWPKLDATTRPSRRYRVELRQPDGSITEGEVTAATEADARAQAAATVPAGSTLHRVELREGEPVINRYRIELRHPDLDGTDGEVLAATEDDALAQAAALAPEGTTVHRVVLMEVDYVAPPPPEPPVEPTDPTGVALQAASPRATGVISEPGLEARERQERERDERERDERDEGERARREEQQVQQRARDAAAAKAAQAAARRAHDKDDDPPKRHR